MSDLDVSTPATKTASSRLVLLLAAALFINYVDRGNLATAAPLIQDELHLSNTQLGVLLSAFYWTYVAVMAPGGWLAERYGAKLILGVGVAIWSVATLLTGLAGGFLSLLLLRLLLGVGESAGFPCSSKLLASDVDPRSVGTANGVLGFGYLIGFLGEGGTYDAMFAVVLTVALLGFIADRLYNALVRWGFRWQQ